MHPLAVDKLTAELHLDIVKILMGNWQVVIIYEHR